MANRKPKIFYCNGNEPLAFNECQEICYKFHVNISSTFVYLMFITCIGIYFVLGAKISPSWLMKNEGVWGQKNDMLSILRSNFTFVWPCIVTCDLASWHVTVHRDMWPCIVTYFFIIKPTRCTNFTNLFWHETLHVSDSSSVHRQEFIHCTLSNGICHTGLKTALQQDQDGTQFHPGPAGELSTNLYDIYHCWVHSE